MTPGSNINPQEEIASEMVNMGKYRRRCKFFLSVQLIYLKEATNKQEEMMPHTHST